MFLCLERPATSGQANAQRSDAPEEADSEASDRAAHGKHAHIV